MLTTRISFKTVFSRVLVFNIILVIIITIVPQQVFLNSFKANYENEINLNNMQMVAQIQKSIDGQVLEKVVTLPVTYLSELPSNEDLTYALHNNITKEPGRIRNISDRLNDIKSTLPFLDSMDLYYTQGNVFFMDKGVQFLDDISSAKMHDLEWVSYIKNSDVNVEWVPTRHVERYQSRDIISFVRRVPFNALGDAVKAIVVVNINEEVIRNFITDVQAVKAGDILVVNENGDIISHGGRRAAAKNIRDYAYFHTIVNADASGVFQVKIDGKMSVVSFSKSDVNDWMYISISSIDEFYQKSYQLKNFLLTINLLLLLVNLAAAVLLTKKAHEPINNIIKVLRSISYKFVNSNGALVENEYKFLSNTIKNIESKMDDLNYKLEINKPLIRHSILLKLLTGKMSVRNHEDTLFDVRFEKERFVCFILKIYEDIQLTFEDTMLVKYNLVELLDGEYPDWEVRTVIDDNGEIAGIINYAAEVSLDDIERDMKAKLETLLRSKYIFCLGNSYLTRREEIHASYREAGLCLQYAFIRTDKKVLRYADLTIEALKTTVCPPRFLEKIEDFVRSADEENLRLTVKGLVEMLKTGGYKIDYCKNTLMDVISLIRMTVSTMGYNPDEIFGDDIRDRFKDIRDIDEFKLWVEEITGIYAMKVNEKKQGLQDDLDIKIKKYIEDHVYQELSLENVASGLYISAGHLSRIFKARNGMTFSSYVTEVKLQYAVRLLQDGKLQVKDIAVKLGYHSVHHFIKIFKEKYGYTPKEYQKITS